MGKPPRELPRMWTCPVAQSGTEPNGEHGRERPTYPERSGGISGARPNTENY